MSVNLGKAKAYKMVFAITGKPKSLRAHAKKSLQKTEQQTLGKRTPQVMLKISSFSKSAKSLSQHLDYVSRNSKVITYDSMDSPIGTDKENQSKSLHRIAKEIADRDTVNHNKKNKRLTANIILSMPPRTNKKKFEAGVREFLGETFANHDYTYAFHDDTKQYHSHVAVPMIGLDGKRLNPRRDDLMRWKEDFSKSLRNNGLRATSSPAPSRNLKTHKKESFKYPNQQIKAHGEAPYSFDDKNKNSYYVTLSKKGAKDKTIWGKDLKRVIEEKGLAKGDEAYFKYKGTEEVEINVPEKRIKGEKQTYKKITVDRHTWDGEKIKTKIYNQKPLPVAARKNVLEAWQTVYRDLKDNKHADTAKLVKNHVFAAFKVNIEVKKQKNEEELTR